MSTDHLLEDFRRWVRALEGLGASRIRFQSRGLQVSLVVVACLTSAIGGLIAVGSGSAHPVALMLFTVAAMSVGAWVVCRRTDTVPPTIVWALHGFVMVTFVFGTVRNGASPMILAPCAIVLSHALVGCREALWFGVTLIASMVAALLVQHGVDPVVAPRAIGAMVATLFFMQLTSRYWVRWAHRAAVISRELQSAVEALDQKRRHSESQLEEVRCIDEQSGLPNARGFVQRGRALMHSASSTPSGLVISIRLMRWGDGCVRHPPDVSRWLVDALVRRLHECFGESALVGRSSVEEFEVFLLAGDSSGQAEALRRLNQHVETLERPWGVGTALVVATPRIGVSLWPQDADDMVELLEKAHLARDAAVRRGLALPVTFGEKVVAQTAMDEELIHDLLQGLRQGEFALWWQPIMDCGGASLQKAEALLRWQHPQRGLVMPESFIPLAEQSRLAFDLTEWVLQQAVGQVTRWRESLHPHFQVSVNIPASWLVRCAAEPQSMVERMSRLRLAPQSVVLEISEGSLLEVTPEITKVMVLLKGLGFQLALDDFGVGYSNFGQLEKLDIDFLKLDKTFVVDLELKPSRRAICEALVTMAHHLGARVVAEGVERVEQLEWLQALGVDCVQGHLLSRPMPAAAVDGWAHSQTQAQTREGPPPAAIPSTPPARHAWAA